MVLEDLFLFLHFFTRPPIFLPVHIRFYPFKRWVDGSLHKAILATTDAVSQCIQVKHLHTIYLS